MAAPTAPDLSEADVAALLKHHDFDPSLLERISRRKEGYEIKICDYDAQWPAQFEALKSRLEAALGSTALLIDHVGSTSVPGLPAKAMIDIDLTVRDVEDEASYVPALEAAGFQFLLREPYWHQHRFFCAYEPMCNLHVWGPGSIETVRHKLFRDWLKDHADDREAYAQTKRESADITNQEGGSGMDYNLKKEDYIRGLLTKIFKAHGYIK